MERHLHPVYNERSFVEAGCMVKLVVGARYGEMFHSASQLVKFAAEPTEFEKRVHFGLQDTALGYADAFREGQTEGELYNALAEVFKTAAKKHGLPGFEGSAYLHHPGGPLSPLGNREFIISKDGKRKIIPYAQFAVNPVDCLAFLKFELQGMVQPHSQPLIFDEFSQVNRDKNCFDIREFYGRQLKLPTILSCSGFSESGK